MIQISKFSFINERYQNLLKRQGSIPAEIMSTVAEILENVRVNGDKALNMYMSKYDGIDLEKESILVSEEEFERARNQVDITTAEAIKRACDNIMLYHKQQKLSGYKVEYENGVVLERRYKPLQRAAVTVPGDMAPLVSSMYMNLIPAIVAGVPEIYVITKPKNGIINPILLFTADYLGVRNIYKISGAQGIAAVAYGTERVKKVDMIAGPGNNYTQAAKKLLYGNIRVDSLAGPSEIAIIADDSANPEYIAADVLSQAEHGTGFEASTVFCTSIKQAEDIKMQIEKIIKDKKLNADIIEKALYNYGDIFVVDNLLQAVNAVNEIAPEHVELQGKEAEALVDKVVNAGAVFVGEYSTEPVGDYFCGTNHILPTCGTARFSSGLSVNDFIRGYSIINYTKDALMKNADFIIKLAKTEGLDAHSYAVEVRKNYIQLTN